MLVGSYSYGDDDAGLYDIRREGAEILAIPIDGTRNHTWFIELGDGRLLATVEEEEGSVAVMSESSGHWTVQRLGPITVSHPCHIARRGGLALVAGYSSAALEIIEISTMRRRISLPFPSPQIPRAERQLTAHPHFSGPWGKSWWATDLGGDVLREVGFRGEAGLTGDLIRLPSGSGPRHFIAGAMGLVCVGELDSTIYRVRRKDQLVVNVDGVRTTNRSVVNAPSHVGMLKTGIVLVANRGAGTLGVVDASADRLRLLEEVELSGPSPRHFRASGSQIVVADDVAGHVEFLRIDSSMRVLDRRLVSVPGAAFIGQMASLAL